MIQILTGKFFTSASLHVTPQRGILHTNYDLHEAIGTAVGTLEPVDDVHGQRPHHLVFEFEQRMEATRPDGSPEPIMGVGVDQILVDMAAIVSFELEVTCSPNPDIVARLARPTSGPRSSAPASFVPRVFDPDVRWRPPDGPRLAAFVDALVGLERDRFEKVMRAVRRYVTALRRLDDDPGMAYALLVAAVESLAQRYDDHQTTWADLPEDRRNPIDAALTGVNASVADGVRDAILAREHVALGRRFEAFVVDHIPSSYARADAVDRIGPAPLDLIGPAVRRAYGLRSSAVHTLSGLPDAIGYFTPHADIVHDQKGPTLTVAGLARLCRAVIQEFVRRSPQVATENVDYRRRMNNTVTASLAPSMWIGHAAGFDHDSAHRYLQGFLEQLSSTLTEPAKDAVTDLAAVLTKIEALIAGVSLPQRRPMLALYVVYASVFRHLPEYAGWFDRMRPHFDAFDEPSIESLVASTFGDLVIPTDDLGAVEDAFKRYLKRWHKKGAFRLPPVFNAAVALDVAEAYRTSGDEVGARRLITHAVELYPGVEALLALETPGPLPVIRWRDHLGLPASEDTEGSTEVDDTA